MSAGAVKFWVLPLLLVLVMASVVSADDSCPACKDFLNNPHAKVIVTLDEPAQTANIVVYYENFSETPARLPVGNSIIIVELTNSSGGLKQLYKTYTDADGKANFSYAAFAKPCVNIKALYCPFCLGGGTECGFAQCLSYSKIHNESSYYSNIAVLNLGHPITLASDIPDSSPPPSSFNPNLYFPDLGTVQYCAPPVATNVTPPLCLPLIIIFSLLSGAMYIGGRNPFAAFNLGGARVGKHIRYQARGRGFSMNVQSLINAVSSGIKMGKAAAKGELGKNIKADAAQNSPGKLVNMAGSKMGLAANKEAGAMTKGMGAGAKVAYMDAKMAQMKGGNTAPGLKNVGGTVVQTPGSSGGVRGSDFMKANPMTGKMGLNWGAIGMFIFSQSAIGRMVDGFRTISDVPGQPSNAMWGKYVASSGIAATRAMGEKVALDALKDPTTGGLKVMGSDGSIRILTSHTDGVESGRRVSANTFSAGQQLIPKLDAKGNPMMSKDGSPIMIQATATVTVKSVAANDGQGNPIMNNPNAIQVNGKDVIANKDGTFTVQGTMRVNGQDVTAGPMIPSGKVGEDGKPVMVQSFIVPGAKAPGVLNANNELVVGATFNSKGEIVGGTPQKVTTDGTAQAMLNPATGQLLIGATANKDGKVEGGIPVPMTIPTRKDGSGIEPEFRVPPTVSNPQAGDTTPTLLATGVKDGRLVTFEPTMKVESTTTTYTVPGEAGKPPAITTVTAFPPGSMTADGKPQPQFKVEPPQGVTLTEDAKKAYAQAASMTVAQTMGSLSNMDSMKMAAEINSTTLNSVSTFEAIQKSGLDNIKNAKLAEEARAQEMIAGDPKKLEEYQARQREVAGQALADSLGMPGSMGTKAGAEYMAQLSGGNADGAAGVIRNVHSTMNITVLGSEEARFNTASTIASSTGLQAHDAPAVAVVIREAVALNGSQTLDQLATAKPAKDAKPGEFLNIGTAMNLAVAQGTITTAQRDAILKNPDALTAIANNITSAAANTSNLIAPSNSFAGAEFSKRTVDQLNGIAAAAPTLGLNNPGNDPDKINLNVYAAKPSSSPELQATLNYQQTLNSAATAWERVGTASNNGQFDNTNVLGTTAVLNTRTVDFANNAQAVNVIHNVNASDYMRGDETPYQKAEIENNVRETKRLFLEQSTTVADIAKHETYLMGLPYREPSDPNKPYEPGKDAIARYPASIEEARVAYDQNLNRVRNDVLGALTPSNPDKPDDINYRLASERATQAAEVCRQAGDEKGYLLWSYQSSILGGVARDNDFTGDKKAQAAFSPLNPEGVAPGGYFTKNFLNTQPDESLEHAEERRNEAYRKVIGQVRNDIGGDPAVGGWSGYSPNDPSHRLYGTTDNRGQIINTGTFADERKRADQLGQQAVDHLGKIVPRS